MQERTFAMLRQLGRLGLKTDFGYDAALVKLEMPESVKDGP